MQKAGAITDDIPTHWFCFSRVVSVPFLDQLWEEGEKSTEEREGRQLGKSDSLGFSRNKVK